VRPASVELISTTRLKPAAVNKCCISPAVARWLIEGSRAHGTGNRTAPPSPYNTSKTTNIRPGFRTRCALASSESLAGTFIRAWIVIATSKLARSNGKSAASPWTKCTWSDSFTYSDIAVAERGRPYRPVLGAPHLLQSGTGLSRVDGYVPRSPEKSTCIIPVRAGEAGPAGARAWANGVCCQRCVGWARRNHRLGAAI
jgi:hypothetical protein